MGSPRRTALIACLGMLAAGPAAAYILPADAILAAVGKRRAQMKFKTLVLEGTRENPSTGTRSTVWLAIKPGTGHRIEVKDTEGHAVELVLGRKRYRYQQGERARPERHRADLLVDFLGHVGGDKGGKRGLAFLDAHGIDDEQVSYQRLDRRIAWVIGEGAPSPNKPQLWIDKRLRVPIRLITVDKRTKQVTDTRLLEYGSAQVGDWFPKVIEVWRDGELAERTVFNRIRINEPVAKALFDAPS